MRIAFVHDNRFVSGDDGRVFASGQFSYRTWARYLRVFDHLTVVGRAAASGNRQTLSESSGAGVSFEFVPSLAGPLAILRKRGVVKRALRDIVASTDGIIVRLPSETGLLAAQVATGLGKPWAVEVVGCARDALWYHGSVAGKIYAPVMDSRMKSTVRAAPFVAYVTRNYLQQRYAAGPAVTASLSNVSLPVADRAILRRRLQGLNKARPGPVVGFIGSLETRYKGLQIALRALAAVVGRFPDVRLRVLGDGDLGYWRRLASKYALETKVQFDPPRPAGEPVLQWLDQIDLYLQPSFTEGLPRTLLEAMSRACPALGSTAGGIPELLTAECCHRPGDWQTLAAQITFAAEDSQWSASQAKRNFSQVAPYRCDTLEPRRDRFWRKFAAAAGN